MATIKVKVDLSSSEMKPLLDFISDTQSGKYTDEKPEVTQITYKRIDVEEQHNESYSEDQQDDVLFGISS